MVKTQMVKMQRFMLKILSIPLLSGSISNNFDAIYSWNVRRSYKLLKNTKNPLFWRLKVIQGHRCWYHWKGCHLLWWTACLYLSATIFI